MVKCVLPKDMLRVRFPLAALVFYAGVAQLVEQSFRKAGVGSSTLPFGSCETHPVQNFGLSFPLTREGSYK